MGNSRSGVNGMTLVVFSGLPGSGKSTVASALGERLGWPVLSVDPIEGVLRRNSVTRDVAGLSAYEIVGRLAKEQLERRISVIVDAVNAVSEPRAMWRGIANDIKARHVLIECRCTDIDLHRRRVEARVRNIPGMPELTWAEVEHRRVEFEPWTAERLVLETSQSAAELLEQALDYLGLSAWQSVQAQQLRV